MNANTLEIKNRLHKLIVETDDENILTKVQNYFLNLKDKPYDWADNISEKEKDAIELGLTQLKNGEGIPHKEVAKKVQKLLAE